jgi:hypothetical protein
MKWLYLLLRGNRCRHKWTVIHQSEIYETAESKFPHSRRYTLQCTKCGDITSRKV